MAYAVHTKHEAPANEDSSPVTCWAVVQERVTDRWGTNLCVLTGDGTETGVDVMNEVGERARFG